MQPLSVVFMGTPAYAVPTCEGIVASGARLAAVVCQPDKPQGRGLAPAPPAVKVWAQQRGIPVHQPEKVRNGLLKAVLEPYAPDLVVVTAYGRILPKEVLDLPRLGCVNLHASLLPKYRGAAPIQWAIANGETVTGVTLMHMDEGLDTGDVLAMREWPIPPDATSADAFDVLAKLSGTLIAESIPLLAEGKLQRIPQDHANHTLARLLDKEDGFLDLRLPAKQLSDRLRGFTPWPGATLFLAGKPVKVHKAALGPSTGTAPGTIVGVGASLDVETGDGVLKVLELQPENRRRMQAADFLAGHRLAVGDRFDVPPPAKA